MSTTKKDFMDILKNKPIYVSRKWHTMVRAWLLGYPTNEIAALHGRTLANTKEIIDSLRIGSPAAFPERRGRIELIRIGRGTVGTRTKRAKQLVRAKRPYRRTQRRVAAKA